MSRGERGASIFELFRGVLIFISVFFNLQLVQTLRSADWPSRHTENGGQFLRGTRSGWSVPSFLLHCRFRSRGTK